ncbi:MAG: KEOPS complex subunit Cgi121 [Thermoplasmata archaeon]
MMELPIAIIGARGPINDVDSILEKADTLSKKNMVEIQLMDADMICGRPHLLSAIEHAKRSFERRENTCTTLSKEILLYAAGERQIKNALKTIGIKKDTKRIAMIVTGKCSINALLRDMDFTMDNSVLDEKIGILQKYGVSKKEADSVIKSKIYDLILERVAMVDIIK